jgi:hypothetical protein
MATMVLSEDEALELIAFLLTAARTQIDEAAEYGPLRLLTAASRLAEMIVDRVTPETRAFLAGPLRQVPDTRWSAQAGAEGEVGRAGRPISSPCALRAHPDVRNRGTGGPWWRRAREPDWCIRARR